MQAKLHTYERICITIYGDSGAAFLTRAKTFRNRTDPISDLTHLRLTISLALSHRLTFSLSFTYSQRSTAVFTCGLRLAETAHELTKGDHQIENVVGVGGEREKRKEEKRTITANANYEYVNICSVAIDRETEHPLLLLTNPNRKQT